MERPKLYFQTVQGVDIPSGSEWSAGLLGEHGWAVAEPVVPIVSNIYDDLDRYGISIQTYDGRDRRTSYYNAFADPAGSGDLITLDHMEIIYEWTRWRPPTQNAGMNRHHIYLPPISDDKRTGWMTALMYGPPGKDEEGVALPQELLTEITLTLRR